MQDGPLMVGRRRLPEAGAPERFRQPTGAPARRTARKRGRAGPIAPDAIARTSVVDGQGSNDLPWVVADGVEEVMVSRSS